MSKTFPFFTVDSFTTTRYRGNPAAVCILDVPVSEEWMQTVAAEMNLSETTFLLPHPIGWDIAWFTPVQEVDLCGHATLAASHILWEAGYSPLNQPIRFASRSGKLTCTRNHDRIEMDFPAEPPEVAEPPTPLLAGIGVRPLAVGRNRFDYIVQLDSEEAVRRLQPDIDLLNQLPERGVIVTAVSSDPQFDFVSRFFAPQCGIAEDPVCGSAHCCLGPFWQARLNKAKMVGHQVSKREGIIHVHCKGDRVVLGGQAVTVLRGQLPADGSEEIEETEE